MSRTERQKFSNSEGNTIVNDPMKPCEYCFQFIGSHDGDGYCPTTIDLPSPIGSPADDARRVESIIAGLEPDPHVIQLESTFMSAFFIRHGDEQFYTFDQMRNVLQPIPIASRDSATRPNYRREFSNKRREVERAALIGGYVATALRYSMGDIERDYRGAIFNEIFDTEDSKGKAVKKPLYGNDAQRADELAARCAGDDVYTALERCAARIERTVEDLKIYEAWLRREHRQAEIEYEFEYLGRRSER